MTHPPDTPEPATLLQAVAEPRRRAILAGLAMKARREGRHQLYAWASPEPTSAAAALLRWLGVWLDPHAGESPACAIGNRPLIPAYPGVRLPALDDHLLWRFPHHGVHVG